MIKYKGNQVPPAELEEVLLSHPLVVAAGVCGIFDETQATEIPVGYVSLRPHITEISRGGILNEIRDYVDFRVASYKKLRGLVPSESDPERANRQVAEIATTCQA